MDRQCVDGYLVPGTEQKGNYTATLSASRFACRSPPLVLGEALGRVFGQSIVHAQAIDLYCAIGMAAFIAAGYKTPLAAVAFVAETTGTPAYLIPALIGAAVACAASGEASVVVSQRLRQMPKLSQPVGLGHARLCGHKLSVPKRMRLCRSFSPTSQPTIVIPCTLCSRIDER
jgi:hypothetical protein